MQTIPSAVRTLLKGKVFMGSNAPKTTVTFPGAVTAYAWETKTSLSTLARRSAGAGAVSDIIYVVGGTSSGGGGSSLTDAYDPTTDSWSAKATMTTRRGQLAAATTGGIIYAIGGAIDPSTATNVNEAYDPVGNSWSSKTAMTTTRFSMGGAVVNGIIYVVGGTTNASNPPAGVTNKNEAYDPDLNSWSTKANLTTARYGLAVVAQGSLIYAMAGYDGSASSNVNEAYLPSANAWSTKTSVPTTRSEPAAAVLDSIIHLIGGNDYAGTHEAYYPTPDSWTTETALPSMRASATAATAGSAIYVIAGRTQSVTAVQTNEAWVGTATDLTIQPTSIHISRQKSATAQRATLEWPNINPADPADGGYYSPDRGDDVPGDKNSWYQVLFPGRDFTIAAGYGANTATVFKGQTDRTTMSVMPQLIDGGLEVDYTITVDGRDYGYRLLDKAVDDGTGVWYLSYSAQAVEDVVDDLLQRAGFTAGDITTEATGMTVTTTFQRMTYADALQKLRDLTGFDLIISETGTVSFHYPTDRQPAITNLAVILTGTTAVNITGGASQGTAPIVSASEVVTNTAGTVTYVKNTDYTITYGAQGTEATLARIATGAITDGQTVHVDYVYAAWVFREGQDLFWLPYSIDRSNMYEKIVVLGQDTATDPPTVVSGTYTWGSAATYGVTGKVLFMEIPELTTGAACQAAADQAGNDMIVKLREVQFAAVPVPWLQVGDSVQVIESSSTASEIYRITGIELTYSADEAIMVCTAYYYGYAPL